MRAHAYLPAVTFHELGLVSARVPVQIGRFADLRHGSPLRNSGREDAQRASCLPPPERRATPPLSGGLGVLNVALEPVESIALTIDLLLELPEEEVSVIYGETMGCDRWGEWVQCETLPARGHR